MATKTWRSHSRSTRAHPDRPTEHGQSGDVKPVGHGISELRINYGPGYRIYYLHEGERLILLLCGGDKTTQQADILTAHQIAEDWRTHQGHRP